MAADPPPERPMESLDRLDRLIAKWRDRAEWLRDRAYDPVTKRPHAVGYEAAYFEAARCADDLEALRAAGDARPQPDVEARSIADRLSALRLPADEDLETVVHDAATFLYDVTTAGDARPQPTWQPMETAPKDGTRILVWRDSGMHIVRWSLPGFWNEWHASRKVSMQPTHWLPLPAPPVSGVAGDDPARSAEVPSS